jgi:CBS domain containing-hemolysin-like protein
MPKVGDKIEFMGVTFEVLKVGDYSVEEVRVNV